MMAILPFEMWIIGGRYMMAIFLFKMWIIGKK
jgi:hypothetical protein